MFSKKTLTIERILYSLIALLSLSILVYAALRKFDIDEFEAIHTAWKISQGETIYIDFFQHHHPLLYYLLVPLINFFGESYATLLATRLFMFFLMLISGMIVYQISNLVYDRKTAILSVLMLFALGRYSIHAIEVRPDGLQATLGLLSIFFLLRFFDKRKNTYLIASALSASFSFLALQKAIFLLIAIGLVLSLEFILQKLSFKRLLIYGFTIFIPIGIYALYFLGAGTFPKYFLYCFIFNTELCWPTSHLSVVINVLKIFLYTFFTSLFIWFFYFVGIFTRNKTFFEKIIILISLLTTLSLFLVHRPGPPYLLQGLPFVAIISAGGCTKLLKLRPNLLVLCAIIITIIPIGIHYIRRPILSPNRTQWERIAYINSITTKNDYVVGFATPDRKDNTTNYTWNLFRKDYNFFWFCTRDPIERIYKLETGTAYEFGVAQAISKFKPKVILKSSVAYDAQKPEKYILEVPEIQNFYHQSDIYDEVLIRI